VAGEAAEHGPCPQLHVVVPALRPYEPLGVEGQPALVDCKGLRGVQALEDCGLVDVQEGSGHLGHSLALRLVEGYDPHGHHAVSLC